MIYRESGWCLADAVASTLGDHVLARLWGSPVPMVVQNSFQRVFGCKGGWLHFPLKIESL